MYIHFESIDRPLNFARKVAEALKVLRGQKRIKPTVLE